MTCALTQPTPAAELAVRDRIERLKQASLLLPQVEVPVQHYFARGICAREMRVPKGVTITGKIHKYSTVDVLLQGSILVVTQTGELQKLEAPLVIESAPGMSKAGYVLEDLRWITFHGTHETDIDKMVAEQVVNTYEQYLTFCGAPAPQIQGE